MSVLLYSAGGDPLITKPDAISIPADFDPSAPQPGVACRFCGCTDGDGCLPDCLCGHAPGAHEEGYTHPCDTHGCGCRGYVGAAALGCFWVAPGVCSSCAPDTAAELVSMFGAQA